MSKRNSAKYVIGLHIACSVISFEYILPITATGVKVIFAAGTTGTTGTAGQT
jgi:hypothetical protein